MLANEKGQLITRGSRVYEVVDVCPITNEITLNPVKDIDVKLKGQNVNALSIEALIQKAQDLQLIDSLSDVEGLRDTLTNFFARKV